MAAQDSFERRLLQGLPSAILVCNETGVVSYATALVADLLGSDPLGTSLAALASGETRAAFVGFLDLLADSPEGTRASGGLRIAADNYERVLEVAGVNRLADLGGLALVLSDVTAHHQRAEALTEQATTDALTGLANRLVAGDRMHQVWRSGRTSAVALLDIDHFKAINDEYGHAVGDSVLSALSRRLELVFESEPDATVARYGGEEFLIVLPGVEVEQARRVCDGLLAQLSTPILVGDVELVVGATVGVTTLRSSLSRTLAEADLALYAGKGRGRGCVVAYHPELAAPRRAQVELVDRLNTQNAVLARESRTDPLTGLLNRRSFDESLPLVHEAAQASGRRYAVVFVDLDFFGAINKAAGQDEGDAALRGAAQALRAGTRSADAVYRVGGEELVALLIDVSEGDSVAIAERMREALAEAGLPHPAHPNSSWVTASIGVAECDPKSGLDPLAVVSAADEAMRVAKRAGGDRVALAS